MMDDFKLDNFKLFGGYSALSILKGLPCNTICDRYVYREDCWIYKDGQKLKKWYVSRDYTKTLWLPNLLKISWLDDLHSRLFIKAQKHWDDVVVPLLNEAEKLSPEKVYANHNGCLLGYTIYNNGGTLSYSPYPAEKLDTVVASDLGNKIDFATNYNLNLWQRAGRIKSAFTEAISTKIHNEFKHLFPKGRDAKKLTFRVNVNSRVHIFNVILNCVGVARIEQVSHSNDIKINIK